MTDLKDTTDSIVPTATDDKILRKLQWMHMNDNLGTTGTTTRQDDRDEGYEWLGQKDPNFYKYSEVRLLNNVCKVGKTAPNVNKEKRRERDNLLICGDARTSLRSLTKLPEFSREYVNKVKLVYIDPPFNTGRAFDHYEDGLEHEVWMTLMKDRLTEIKILLAENGSVWVHLDDMEMHYCKVIMDDIFGRNNYIGMISWQKVYNTKNNSNKFSSSLDHILVYAKNADIWRPTLLPRTEKMDSRYKNPDNDPKGPWRYGPADVMSNNANNIYPVTTPSGRVVNPPSGGSWRFNQTRMQELITEGKVVFGPKGSGVPSTKLYLCDVKDGRAISTFWPHEETGHNQEGKREIKALFPEINPFGTPKPERLLERIIHIGSSEGDIVLDCFAGSGTTAAVAHKMNRRWVTVELSQSNVDAFVLPRLTKVVNGEDNGGVTVSQNWQGGGGFRVLNTAPSAYGDDGDGITYLMPWVTDSNMAPLVAAQLGVHYVPRGPFAGKINPTTHLAVYPGAFGPADAEYLVHCLNEEEKEEEEEDEDGYNSPLHCIRVVAVSFVSESADKLKELRPGSKVSKIPRDIIKHTN